MTRVALLDLAERAGKAGDPSFTHGRLHRGEEQRALELDEEFERTWAATGRTRSDWP